MSEQPFTPFATVVELVQRLEATSKRLEKRRLIANFLRALSRAEVGPAVLLLVAGIFPESDPKVLNIGFATIRKALEAAGPGSLSADPLTILDVQKRFETIAAVKGPESTRTRQELLEEFFRRASKDEQQVLLKAISGEMRIGVNEGVMIEAIADASGADPAAVRAGNMYLGDLGKVAAIALFEGNDAVQRLNAELLFPI